MTNSPNYYSFFDTCAGNVKLWSYVYVYNMGTPVGTVGTFYNIMEWVSDEGGRPSGARGRHAESMAAPSACNRNNKEESDKKTIRL